MAEFWNLILKSNTFNFVVLVAIFWVLAIKLNLPEMLEKLRISVATSIENAKSELETSKSELKNAKKSVKDAEKEYDDKILIAKNSAEGLSKDILNNAKAQVKKIEENVLRVVLSEEKKISAKLTYETMKQAVDMARENIIKKLKSDKELQNKLISDSIEELDKIKL